MWLDENLVRMAEEQHGVLAIWQLRALGASHDDVYDLRRSVDWVARTKRVLIRAGSPDTQDQRWMAAVLDASPGAVLGGRTGAAFWGVPGYRAEPIEVLRPRGISRRRSGLAVVHEVLDLDPSQIKVVRNIPVASPARVVWDIAAVTRNAERVARALDWLWSHRLLDGRAFHQSVEQLAGRGRTGSTLIRDLDAQRGEDYVPPASGLEARFAQIVEHDGLQAMRRQVDSGDEAWCGRVDFRAIDLPLIVEVQSELFHAALVDRVADARRRAALEAAGFTVVEVWDTQVWHEPWLVTQRIRAERSNLRRILGGNAEDSSQVQDAGAPVSSR